VDGKISEVVASTELVRVIPTIVPEKPKQIASLT
jgi:hypothetical protein